jgi:arginine decarboxylase
MDGNTFRNLLIERYDIQINKTTRNTVLFLVNIGSTSGSATYLLDVLVRVAEELETSAEEQSEFHRAVQARRVESLTGMLPPLPHFSRFHAAFVDDPTGDTREGDMRKAFFLAYDGNCCEHLPMDGSLAAAMQGGRAVVSASFVTPYPPGLPILVPGQVVTEDILAYLKALDVKEIHGYDAAHGLRVFRQDALERLEAERAASSTPRPSKSRKETASR